MNWLWRAIGWGIVIYALMYLVWSGLVIYGLSIGLLSLLIRFVTLIVILRIAVRTLRLSNWKDILPYSLTWAVLIALLDGIYLVPFAGFALYSTWSVWAGYMLVVVLPLLGALLSTFRRRRMAPTSNPHLA